MHLQKSPKEKPCYTLPTVKKLLEQKRKRETSSAPPTFSSTENTAAAAAAPHRSQIRHHIRLPVSGTNDTRRYLLLSESLESLSPPSPTGANSSFSDMAAMRYHRWDSPMQPLSPTLQEYIPFPSVCLNYLQDSPPAALSFTHSLSFSAGMDPHAPSYNALGPQEHPHHHHHHHHHPSSHFGPNADCPVTSGMPIPSDDLSVQGMSLPSYEWSSGTRPQDSTGPCGLSGRPQMNMDMAMLDEARLFLQTMDYSRTTWKDDDGDTILHIYTAKGEREYAFAAAEKLQELGKLDTKEHRGKTALLVAVAANQPEIVQDLLTLGADISICDNKGQTALHLAATYGFPQVMKVILSMRGVDLEARNFEGLTPLHCAVISHNATTKALASNSSSAWTPDGNLQSHADNKLLCLQMLLEAGASLTSQEIKSNKTSLHLAVKEGNIQLVHLFLSQQIPDMPAFINMKAHGHTALHMAAGLHGSPYQEDLIRLLLGQGGDPSIRNLENDQPVHLLQNGQQGEKLKLILKKRNASRRRIASLQDQE